MAKADGGEQLKINMEESQKPIFWNLVLVRDTHAEIILDFCTKMPQQEAAYLTARMVSSPPNAKRLLEALTIHVEKYEALYGEIVTDVHDLAGQLFTKPEGEES